MSEVNQLDEIEIVDLEEYACADRPIPKRVKYYLIKVDDEKFRVQSPIKASEILIVADLDPCDYNLIQKFRGGRSLELEPDQVIDLREPGVERFVSIPSSDINIIVNGRQEVVNKKRLSFSEIVNIAHDGNPPTGEFICFTVTYSNGPRQNPEGTLTEGQFIKVKCGMKLYVRTTDKS